MKAVILAAGRGKRLSTLTNKVPKTLVDVGGSPILAHILVNLRRFGIKDVVIVTGYKATKIREFVSKFGEKIKVNADYIHNDRFNETNNIYSVYLARDKLEDEKFVLLNSDVLFHGEILRALLKSEREGMVLSVDLGKELGWEEMKVRIEDERILEISKEIDPRFADGEYIGITRIDDDFSSEFFDAVKKTIKTDGENVFYESAYQRMTDEGKILTFESTRGLPWIEIDTYEDLRTAREIITPRIYSSSSSVKSDIRF